MNKNRNFNRQLLEMRTRVNENQHSLVTCESVGNFHPDKLSDQISDLVVDAYLQADPMSRVAVETAVKDSEIMLFGEVNSTAQNVMSQLPQLIRNHLIEKIGLNRDGLGMNGYTCSISLRIGQQAAEIERGTLNSEEVGEDAQGAGDQGMMVGYATDECSAYMPLPLMFAHRMVKGLNHLMHSEPSIGLRPDNKCMVTVEYDSQQNPVRIATIVVAQQHDVDVTLESLEQAVRKVANELPDSDLVDDSTIFIVNGTGSFVLGGPHADAGMTGRKIIVDTYGSQGRHGGGAFSGKDPSKVDRSAAYMARCLALQIVANGYAKRAEVDLSYCIGVAEPVSVTVNTFGTNMKGLSDLELTEKITQYYDLRPAGIIKFLDLKNTRYLPTATYGHFGWDAYPWEKIDANF